MDHRIVIARTHHLISMAGNLLEEDKRELEDCYGVNAYFTLGSSFAASKLCWAAVVEGEVIAMFGVVPMGKAGHGRPWMIGTKYLPKHRFKFGKGCAEVIAEMLDSFPHLENIVDCRNRKALQWLKWLGFEFGDIVMVGDGTLPYITFRMERTCSR
jgi:hypothetical protein